MVRYGNGPPMRGNGFVSSPKFLFLWRSALEYVGVSTVTLFLAPRSPLPLTLTRGQLDVSQRKEGMDVVALSPLVAAQVVAEQK
jgi:hypothetical protein